MIYLELDLDLAPVKEAFRTVIQVASGDLTVEELTAWIRGRLGTLGNT